MLPYENFVRGLKQNPRYRKNFSGWTEVPIEDFKKEMGNRLYIHSNDGEMLRGIREMESLNLIHRRQQTVLLYPDFQDLLR